jgi:hypothetical protein
MVLLYSLLAERALGKAGGDRNSPDPLKDRPCEGRLHGEFRLPPLGNLVWGIRHGRHDDPSSSGFTRPEDDPDDVFIPDAILGAEPDTELVGEHRLEHLVTRLAGLGFSMP